MGVTRDRFDVRRCWLKFVAAVISAAIALGMGWAGTMPALADVSPVQVEGNFVTAAIERVGGAVVRIDTERTVNPNPDFFGGLFGDESFGIPEAPRGGFKQRGQGSGFIIDPIGTILTNAHVVDRADRVTVRLKDGRRYDAEVLGADEITDLAVVKISSDEGNFPTVPLGDSDRVQVGDWAIAVGNPLGLDNTVTLGIVSTLKRSSAQVGVPDKRLDFIQTDAAINPGNSGGPLLNQKGEAIGINTAIRADAMGIGFAIPTNVAKEIYPQLAQGEQVAHPYVGIQMITLTPELARENNLDANAPSLPEIHGILVVGVLPNSPAAQAGLRRGDVITAVEGTSVASAEELQRLVERSHIGQRLAFQLQRGDRSLNLAVRTASLQERS